MSRRSKVLVFTGLVGAMAAGTAPAAYTYNPTDFATQVINYTQGTGVGNDYISGQPYTNFLNALGRPTIDTTGDGWSIATNEAVPVVPIYGAWRSTELVSIGHGGSLTLKFDRPVYNNPGNPRGTDFIIFGNASVYVDGINGWDNRDPGAMSAGSAYSTPSGTVSVSKDGANWVPFPASQTATRFPALGRIYDPTHADSSVGSFNLWWSQPSDPTLPLDPALSMADLAGKSVTQMAQFYGQSAGGTGFDIGQLSLDWIQYVRIDNAASSGPLPSIDAVSIVSPVPEPGAALLLGLVSLLCLRRRHPS